jgi:hypothetical protein
MQASPRDLGWLVVFVRTDSCFAHPAGRASTAGQTLGRMLRCDLEEGIPTGELRRRRILLLQFSSPCPSSSQMTGLPCWAAPERYRYGVRSTTVRASPLYVSDGPSSPRHLFSLLLRNAMKTSQPIARVMAPGRNCMANCSRKCRGVSSEARPS